MKKYNLESVLYAASKDAGFNVDINESKNRGAGFEKTDIEFIVDNALKAKLIEEVARDDSDIYYKNTIDGEIKLRELQIEYRKSKGKCILSAQGELKTLLECK